MHSIGLEKSQRLFELARHNRKTLTTPVKDLMVFSCFGSEEVIDLFKLKGGNADLQV